jgi:hypothetical protein
MKIALALFAFALASAQDLAIHNELFEVKLNANTFSIAEHGLPIVRDGTLRDRGSARASPRPTRRSAPVKRFG